MQRDREQVNTARLSQKIALTPPRQTPSEYICS